MPLFGTLDAGSRAVTAPTMSDFAVEPVTLERTTVLQVLFELRGEAQQPTLPPALHPTSPPTGSVMAYRVPDGPMGPFQLVMTRIGCRAGTKLRGFVTRSFVDNPDVAAVLDAGWGYGCTVADLEVRSNHDRVRATVELDGRTVVDVEVRDPQPISGSDVFYNAGMHLAHTPVGLRLVQVDPDYVFQRADRGRPVLHQVDGGACGEPLLEVAWPISASVTVAEVTLPGVRFVCDPDVPAAKGTERVG